MQIKLTAAEFAASARFISKAVIGLAESQELLNQGAQILTLSPKEYLALYPEEGFEVLDDGSVLWTVPEEETVAVIHLLNLHSDTIVSILKMLKTVAVTMKHLFYDIIQDFKTLQRRKPKSASTEDIDRRNMMNELGELMVRDDLVKEIIYINSEPPVFHIDRDILRRMVDDEKYAGFLFTASDSADTMTLPGKKIVIVHVSRWTR